ncbi:MAG: phosphatase PAP2 family protein [Candidatus Nanopelagicales bacterium]|nr:phosphatase PAP2 family protein [Candidatus Nanopelagicales bacterium]
MDSGADRAWRRALVLGLAVLLGSYVVLVLLPFGQVWDDGLLLDAEDIPRGLARELTQGLHWINVVTWAVMAAIVAAVGAVRAIAGVGAWAAAGLVVTMALAETLKIVLPRPDWGVDTADDLLTKAMDTWPSGHTASVAAFTLALICVTSARARAWVIALGASAITAVGAGVVLAGWHRPSDIFGGSALALVVFLLLRFTSSSDPAGVSRRWLMAGTSVAAAVVVALISARAGDLEAALALVVTMAAFGAWAAIVTTTYANDSRP